MPQNNPPQKQQLLSIWWLILIALLLWNLFGIWSTQNPVAKIPYSTFIHQVKDDNVEKVSLMGGEIRGTFVKPVLWPPAKGVTKAPPTPAQTVPAEASAKKTANPSPSATTEAPAAAKTPTEKTAKPSPSAAPGTPAKPFTPRRYQHFMTVFPEEIGDANLLPLLESHGVQVSAESPTSPFFSIVFANLLPFLLLVAFFWWMGRRANQHRGSIFGGLRGFTQAQARRYNSE
jgi:cell division protease FtsH